MEFVDTKTSAYLISISMFSNKNNSYIFVEAATIPLNRAFNFHKA